MQVLMLQKTRPERRRHDRILRHAERLRGTCPMGVFDIEDLAGTSTLVVGNDLNCT